MLCRACGTEMEARETCPACNEAVLWKCPSCEKENDKSIHTYHARSSWAASVFLAAFGMMSSAYTLVIV